MLFIQLDWIGILIIFVNNIIHKGEISENEYIFVDSAKNSLFLGNILQKIRLLYNRRLLLVAPSMKTSSSLVPIANALRPV